MTHGKLVELKNFILGKYGVLEMKNSCRKRELVEARFFYYRIAYQYGFTYAKIGSLVQKDHATVLHGIKKVKELMSIDPIMRNRYNECEDMVYAYFGRPNKKPDYELIRKEIERLQRILDGEHKID